VPRLALVVDDSRAIRVHMKDRLLALGFDEVAEASNAEEAWRCFDERDPDVVFLDMVLPDLSGAVFAKEVLEAAPRTRIVLVSALARDSNEVTAAISAGVRDFLRKPIDDAELARVVERLKTSM